MYQHTYIIILERMHFHMILVDFYDKNEIDEEQIRFSVITAFYQDKMIVVRHKERLTWEIPGGHKEEYETSKETAERELFEETGATVFDLEWICSYSVNKECDKSYGQLYLANVKELGDLPESEIEEIKFVNDLPKNLTYPAIQPHLYKKVFNYIENLR